MDAGLLHLPMRMFAIIVATSRMGVIIPTNSFTGLFTTGGIFRAASCSFGRNRFTGEYDALDFPTAPRVLAFSPLPSYVVSPEALAIICDSILFLIRE